jgi:hypothetical protein
MIETLQKANWMQQAGLLWWGEISLAHHAEPFDYTSLSLALFLPRQGIGWK